MEEDQTVRGTVWPTCATMMTFGGLPASRNLAKTDRVDARMLARFGAERHLEPTPPEDPARAELGELNQRRDQLKRMETQEKNRLIGCSHPVIKRTIKASLKGLAAQVRDINALIAAHLQTHPALGAQARLLQTIPGIGKVTSTELLAHLSPLGQIDRRAVASLGGLAPRARDSGKFKGVRTLGRENQSSVDDMCARRFTWRR